VCNALRVMPDTRCESADTVGVFHIDWHENLARAAERNNAGHALGQVSVSAPLQLFACLLKHGWSIHEMIGPQ
jgi:hypothetical protein